MEIKTFKPTDHKIKAVIYGASGTGKTTFAASAKNVIFASAEGGLLSVADKGVSYADIKKLKDLSDLLQYLKTQPHNFETVVIDSITEINDIIKNEIEKSKGRNMQLQDWGVLSKKIKEILRGFRDLPMHVVFIAQEMNDKDEDKVVKIVPSLNGKAATEIAYFMDIVGYLRIEKGTGERVCITEPHDRLLSKDRSNKIGNECPVDFSEWINRVSQIQVGEEQVISSFDQNENLLAEEPKKKVETVKEEPKQEIPKRPQGGTPVFTDAQFKASRDSIVKKIVEGATAEEVIDAIEEKALVPDQIKEEIKKMAHKELPPDMEEGGTFINGTPENQTNS